MINNTDRILNAAQTLQAYRKLAPYAADNTQEELLTDLLSDLRHWAENQGIMYVNCDYHADLHFKEERAS